MNPKTFLSLGTMSAAGSGPCGGRLEAGQKPAGALESRLAWMEELLPGRVCQAPGWPRSGLLAPSHRQSLYDEKPGPAGAQSLPPLCWCLRDSHTTAEGLAVAWGAGDLDFIWTFSIPTFPWSGVAGDLTLTKTPFPKTQNWPHAGSVKSGSPIQELPVVRLPRQRGFRTGDHFYKSKEASETTDGLGHL